MNNKKSNASKTQVYTQNLVASGVLHPTILRIYSGYNDNNKQHSVPNSHHIRIKLKSFCMIIPISNYHTKNVNNHY